MLQIPGLRAVVKAVGRDRVPSVRDKRSEHKGGGIKIVNEGEVDLNRVKTENYQIEIQGPGAQPPSASSGAPDTDKDADAS